MGAGRGTTPTKHPRDFSRLDPEAYEKCPGVGLYTLWKSTTLDLAWEWEAHAREHMSFIFQAQMRRVVL